MTGHVAALYRHPIKGFTPQRIDYADLVAGELFPGDRMFAVENGPSGFDATAPAWIAKQKFAVLASIPAVAKARTVYDLDSGVLTVSAEGRPHFAGHLGDPDAREAFCVWLAALIDAEDLRGPLRIVDAPGHRFMDHPKGHVSIVNLASVRDLEARLGRPLDPLRFRANVYVEGWPAWADNDWTGRDFMLGFARAKVFAPIVRCAATHVDPATGVADIEVVKALHDNYGHLNLGVYAHVVDSGRIGVGDAVTAPSQEPAK